MANKSQLAEQALRSISGVYEVGECVNKGGANPQHLHGWMLAQRVLLPNGSDKALDYRLKRRLALTRYL